MSKAKYTTAKRRIAGIAMLAGALGLAGCSPPRPSVEFEPEVRKEVEGARVQLAGMWETINAQARQLTQRSSVDALGQARKKADDLRARLMDHPATTELEKLRLQSISEEIARLDAAIRFQEISGMVRTAHEQVLAGKRVTDEQRNRLLERARKQDPTLQALEAQLASSERAYTVAMNRLQETLLRQQALLGGR
jgi:hypothetical protein